MKPIIHKGQLTKWKDDKGFGFIKPNDNSREVFLHISKLKGASRRPKVGDIILYELATKDDGKLYASKASIEGVTPRLLRKKYNVSKRNFFKILLVILVGIGAIWQFASMELKRRNSYHFEISNTEISSIIQPECNIKGNISIDTGNKVYHLPGMEDYESTRIDASRGERWFCTESEAIANGWRKAPR